ncbi:TonB-linked SusC/RagA family outer membrane protein [Filimonas zeae]|uniref:SusC/RagA family TonB-linked outer membrane protein n=1 Tax=Filimonas zeae TaxID=1737353 RepID=A0A917J4C2_9BACT|nr:SusC/RagA family TonB-linked outer membrane protein [Filimonas zeae]MDR6341064.1 TonB-linked SusC/RagA family outer membrane protein [Filimonas zeae]GGH77372.1 SusC/RagA family TonB-linked outer membrane protein [Filimonas zeae]
MRKLLLFMSLCLLTIQLCAQDRTVTGKITDDKGDPVANATVEVKGTRTATVTRPDGSFTIKAAANAVLVVKSLGFEKIEYPVGTNSVATISLKTDQATLSEVVVTALGIKKDKKGLGYAITELKAGDVTNVPNQNVVNSLNGKVAGLQVISSGGAPGMGSRVVIRGGNKSITGDNQPLFVVDGIPISNANDGTANTVTGAGSPNRAADINPDDIESVSILKGSAAAVLYGNRGSNGVVLITTKSGKTKIGKPVVSISSTVGFDRALKLPDFQTTYAQGQFAGTPAVPTYAEGTSLSFGPKITGQTVASAAAGGNITLRAFDPRKDFLKTGVIINNSVSVSQATEKGSYFLSAGQSRQTSIVPNQDYNKASVRFNSTNNLSSKITTGINLNYIRSWGDVPYAGQDGNNPIFALFNAPVSWDLNGYGYVNPNGTQRNFRGGSFDNPLWSVNKTFYNTTSDHWIAAANVSYKALPWLDFTYRLGADILTDFRKSFRDINSGGSPNGYLSNNDVYRQELTSTFLVNINRKLTKDIGLSLVAGQDYNQRKLKNIAQTATALSLPGITNMANGKSFDPDYEYTSIRRLIGTFGDLRLDYKSYLYLGITARNEWSSTLPTNERSYFYPGANLSFIFTDAFGIDKKVLNYGKVRLAYAQTARDAGVYSLQNVYTLGGATDGFTSGITFPFGSVPGYTFSNTLRNPTLKPEKTTEFEVGGEFRFLDSRINLEATYFRNDNKDGIVAVDVSPATGATNATLNSGHVRSNGIELALNVTPVRTRDFTWDATITYSRIRSKVIETYPGVERISLGGFSGNPAIFAIRGERYGSIVGQKLRRDANGNVIVSATTGRPLYDDGGNLGYIEPDWTGGIRNQFTYKGLTFDFLFDTRQGGVMLNATEDLLDGYGVSAKTASREEDFVYAGVKNTDGKPNDKVVKRDQTWWSAAKVNEEYLYKNNWVKLREANLNYTFTIKNAKVLKSVNVGVYGRNLFLWSDIPHVDPESSSFGTGNAQGVTRMAFPSTRSMGVNLKVVF